MSISAEDVAVNSRFQTAEVTKVVREDAPVVAEVAAEVGSDTEPF